MTTPTADEVTGRLRAAGCVFAEDEARLLIAAAASPAQLSAMVAQRAGGMPLEHVVGWAEFCGLRITVAPGVFVPRWRTEFLVDQAAGLARPGDVVADVCCGAGAIGIAVAAEFSPDEVAALVSLIATINAWNAISVATRAWVPGSYQP